MCGCECCIYSKSMHSSLLSWRESFFEKTQDQICNSQKIRSGEMSNNLFEIYKHYVTPHRNHMFQTESDIAMVTMCEYIPSNYELPHWKGFFVVLRNLYRWIFQVQNHISTIQILDPTYNFMYINTYHFVLFMVYALSRKINSVNCVRLLQNQFLLKNI